MGSGRVVSTSYNRLQLPKRGLWFKFSWRAAFHDKPGFPQLRRYQPVDKRILEMVRHYETLPGAFVCFYKLLPSHQLRSREAEIPTYCVEVRPLNYTGRFLPSWMGYTKEIQDRTMEGASIIYVYGKS